MAHQRDCNDRYEPEPQKLHRPSWPARGRDQWAPQPPIEIPNRERGDARGVHSLYARREGRDTGTLNTYTAPLPQAPRPYRLKPPTFDGKTSIEAFLAQFKVAARGNGWGEEEKGWQLATSLSGSPSEILSQVDVEQPGGYEQLERALRLRYQSTSKACQQKLAGRRQEAGETPQQLADSLQRLVARSFPEASLMVLDNIVSSHFIMGLRNLEVKKYVLLSHPQTLAEHVAAAMEAESLPGVGAKLAAPVQPREIGRAHV